jgi:hypothetical protein
MHETTVRIARLLQLPDPQPAENPFDAINAEIRLGDLFTREGDEDTGFSSCFSPAC